MKFKSSKFLIKPSIHLLIRKIMSTFFNKTEMNTKIPIIFIGTVVFDLELLIFNKY